MMPLTYQIEFYIQLAFSFALIAVEAWALIQALRFPNAAYDAAFKRTKGFWLGMTAGALALGLLSTFTSALGGLSLLLSIVALVMAGVFLADVLPALRSVMSRAQGRYGRR